MADILELTEKLTASMHDLDKLFELANDTWPEMYALLKAKVQMDPSFVEQMWAVLSPNWALIVEDIDQDLDILYEELTEATVDVDIMDWENMWTIFSDLRPELAEQIKLLGFQQCNDEVEGFKDEEAWAMMCEVWRVVTTCVMGEVVKSEVVGKVELKEVLKILVQKLPELVGIGQKELGSSSSVWKVWMRENEGEEGEEQDGATEGGETEKGVTDDRTDSEAADLSPRT